MSSRTDRDIATARVRDLLTPRATWVPAAQDAERRAQTISDDPLSGNDACADADDDRDAEPAGGAASDAGGSHRRPIRWSMSRPARYGLLALAVLSAALGWWFWWQSRAVPLPAVTVLAAVDQQVMPSPSGGAVAPPSAAPGSATFGSVTPTPDAASATIVIDVTGKVRHPGVLTLPAGSRVDDAVAAADGPSPGVDLSTVNLARLLVDGEQVAIGVPGAPAGLSSTTAAATPGDPRAAVVLDLNRASADELDTLPGVGPVMAARIIEWRGQHGRFTSVDELRDISGMGEKKLADLRARVRV